jgi:hypothetical protein
MRRLSFWKRLDDGVAILRSIQENETRYNNLAQHPFGSNSRTMSGCGKLG